MQRIKRITAVLLCALLLSACGNTAPDLAETFPTVPKVEYKTVTAETGTFTMTRQCNAYLIYPDIQNIYGTYEGAILKDDFKLTRYVPIEAGEVIATVYFNVSHSHLQRLELAYSESVRSREETCAAYEARIAQFDSAIEAGGTAGQIAAAQKEQARNECRLYLASADADVEAKRKELTEYRDLFTEKTIVAPCDGIVNWSADLQAGTVIGEHTLLVSCFTDYFPMLRADNPSDRFLQVAVPGTPVTITDNEVTINGTIVTSPTGVDDFGTGNSVFIVSDDLHLLSSKNRYKVVCEGARIDNVLLLDAKAIHTEGNIRYVFVLENGVATRRNVICGPENDGIVCILEGLQAGQQVILDQGG